MTSKSKLVMTRVGMNGLEFFDENGETILIDSIKSNYNSETVDNLTNGIYKEDKEDNFWSGKFPTNCADITIQLDFMKSFSISMIRIWNYYTGKNSWKRGARHITLEIDDQIIFFGEIAAASEGKSTQSKYELILFTNSDEIIEKISNKDWLLPTLQKEDEMVDEVALKEVKNALSGRIDPLSSVRDIQDLPSGSSSNLVTKYNFAYNQFMKKRRKSYK